MASKPESSGAGGGMASSSGAPPPVWDGSSPLPLSPTSGAGDVLSALSPSSGASHAFSLSPGSAADGSAGSSGLSAASGRHFRPNRGRTGSNHRRVFSAVEGSVAQQMLLTELFGPGASAGDAAASLAGVGGARAPRRSPPKAKAPPPAAAEVDNGGKAAAPAAEAEGGGDVGGHDSTEGEGARLWNAMATERDPNFHDPDEAEGEGEEEGAASGGGTGADFCEGGRRAGGGADDDAAAVEGTPSPSDEEDEGTDPRESGGKGIPSDAQTPQRLNIAGAAPGDLQSTPRMVVSSCVESSSWDPDPTEESDGMVLPPSTVDPLPFGDATATPRTAVSTKNAVTDLGSVPQDLLPPLSGPPNGGIPPLTARSGGGRGAGAGIMPRRTPGAASITSSTRSIPGSAQMSLSAYSGNIGADGQQYASDEEEEDMTGIVVRAKEKHLKRLEAAVKGQVEEEEGAAPDEEAEDAASIVSGVSALTMAVGLDDTPLAGTSSAKKRMPSYGGRRMASTASVDAVIDDEDAAEDAAAALIEEEEADLSSSEGEGGDEDGGGGSAAEKKETGAAPAAAKDGGDGGADHKDKVLKASLLQKRASVGDLTPVSSAGDISGAGYVSSASEQADADAGSEGGGVVTGTDAEAVKKTKADAKAAMKATAAASEGMTPPTSPAAGKRAFRVAHHARRVSPTAPAASGKAAAAAAAAAPSPKRGAAVASKPSPPAAVASSAADAAGEAATVAAVLRAVTDLRAHIDRSVAEMREQGRRDLERVVTAIQKESATMVAMELKLLRLEAKVDRREREMAGVAQMRGVGGGVGAPRRVVGAASHAHAAAAAPSAAAPHHPGHAAVAAVVAPPAPAQHHPPISIGGGQTLPTVHLSPSTRTIDEDEEDLGSLEFRAAAGRRAGGGGPPAAVMSSGASLTSAVTDGFLDGDSTHMGLKDDDDIEDDDDGSEENSSAPDGAVQVERGDHSVDGSASTPTQSSRNLFTTLDPILLAPLNESAAVSEAATSVRATRGDMGSSSSLATSVTSATLSSTVVTATTRGDSVANPGSTRRHWADDNTVEEVEDGEDGGDGSSSDHRPPVEVERRGSDPHQHHIRGRDRGPRVEIVADGLSPVSPAATTEDSGGANTTPVVGVGGAEDRPPRSRSQSPLTVQSGTTASVGGPSIASASVGASILSTAAVAPARHYGARRAAAAAAAATTRAGSITGGPPGGGGGAGGGGGGDAARPLANRVVQFTSHQSSPAAAGATADGAVYATVGEISEAGDSITMPDELDNLSDVVDTFAANTRQWREEYEARLDAIQKRYPAE